MSLSWFMSSVSHGSKHKGNLKHLRCNYKLITDYPSLPSPLFSPPNISITHTHPLRYINCFSYVFPLRSAEGVLSLYSQIHVVMH